MSARTLPKPLQRLRAFASDRWYVHALLGATLLALILVLVVFWVESEGTRTDQRVLLTFLINLMAVIGIQVFMSNSGIATFGHVGFVAIGAYAAAILTTPTERKAAESLIPDAPQFILDAQFGLVPSLVIALAVVALVAAVSGSAVVRLRGASAAIATLALLMIIRTVIGNWEGLTRGPKVWSGVPDYTTMGVALAFVVVAIFAARLFRESGLGMRLRATREDELASSAVGVNVQRARLAAWVLSATIAGAAGVLWAHYFLSLAPQDFFFDLTFLYIVMVIFGGLSVSGAVAGAGAVTLITEAVRRTETDGIHLGPIQADEVFGLTPIVLSLLILLVVILRPEGILGRWEIDELMGRALRRGRVGPADAVGGQTNEKGDRL